MKKLEILINSFKMKYELFLIGCDSIEDMGCWDKDMHGEMDAYYANDLTSLIIRLIASDGVITQKETEYLNETFGFDYTHDQLINVYNACKDDIGQAFDSIFRNGISQLRSINVKLADAYIELLSLVCEIIVESDGSVSQSEIAEIKHFLAMCE